MPTINESEKTMVAQAQKEPTNEVHDGEFDLILAQLEAALDAITQFSLSQDEVIRLTEINRLLSEKLIAATAERDERQLQLDKLRELAEELSTGI